MVNNEIADAGTDRNSSRYFQSAINRGHKLENWPMAKKATRKYAPSAGEDVKSEMHRYKRGTAKSGPGGKGGKVKSREQAIAIGLSKARKEGKKVPKKAAS
jgi:hypothetical protein